MSLRAIMEIRARGANRCSTTFNGQACYRRSPAPVRPVRHHAFELGVALLGRRIITNGRVSVAVHRGERPVLVPDRPDDASEPVRDPDGRDVMATALVRAQGLPLECRRLGRSLRMPEHRARAVNHQHAQVDVALLADRPEAPTECR